MRSSRSAWTWSTTLRIWSWRLTSGRPWSASNLLEDMASATWRVFAVTARFLVQLELCSSSTTGFSSKAADPADLDGYDVSRLDRTRVGRGAGEKYVAGLERDEPETSAIW